MSKDEDHGLTVLTPESPEPEEPPPPTPEQRAQVAIDAWVGTLSGSARQELSHNDLSSLQRLVVSLAVDRERKAIATMRWDCLEPEFILTDPEDLGVR